MAHPSGFTADLRGNINGVDFEVHGRGTYDNGLSRGVYEVSTIPEGFDILILNAFLLLGDPSIHRTIQPAVSPFSGSYRYERKLEFADGNRITASVEHDKSTETTKSVFRLQGTSRVPKLDSVNSVVEHWMAPKAGTLSTEIPIDWLAADGSIYKGHISSLYQISPDIGSAPHQLWQRVISHASGKTLEIFQDSVLRAVDA